MEKKTFQKPEVKFVQMNTLNILASSGGDYGDGEGNADECVKSLSSGRKSSYSKGASIPTSSSANWD